MRVLVEYYVVPKQNGYIPKVIYHVLSNRLLDASIIYTFSTIYTQKLKHIREALMHFSKIRFFSSSSA